VVTPRANEIPLFGPLSSSTDSQKIFPVSLGGCYGVSRGDRPMRKMHVHFEIVPVEVAKKVLEKQNAKANRNGHGKRAVIKSEKGSNGANALPKKMEVLQP
jgi:hypothetical protein